jgi:hypothetical protein
LDRAFGLAGSRFRVGSWITGHPEIERWEADLSGAIRRDRLIVVSTLKKINGTIAYAVNQPVFLGNTP